MQNFAVAEEVEILAEGTWTPATIFQKTEDLATVWTLDGPERELTVTASEIRKSTRY
jgi:hypothetical protein